VSLEEGSGSTPVPTTIEDGTGALRVWPQSTGRQESRSALSDEPTNALTSTPPVVAATTAKEKDT